VKISGGTLKLRAKNYKTKNYKLRLVAGSWGLIEALKKLDLEGLGFTT
jgi:hypothetical protein